MACDRNNSLDTSEWHAVMTRPLEEPYLSEINQWIAGDEARGLFDYDPFLLSDNLPLKIVFDDPDTAFAFKMRFG